MEYQQQPEYHRHATLLQEGCWGYTIWYQFILTLTTPCMQRYVCTNLWPFRGSHNKPDTLTDVAVEHHLPLVLTITCCLNLQQACVKCVLESVHLTTVLAHAIAWAVEYIPQCGN
jgi:hypothetical protein